MHINLSTHQIEGIRFCPSPNFDNRPTESTLELIVLHNISLPAGQFGGEQVINFFCNQLDCDSHPSFNALKAMKVSSHLFIRRTGETIQLVPFNKRAWHAGVSTYNNKPSCNDFSIGIELEGCDNTPYEQRQYQALAEVLTTLLQAYPTLSQQCIVGHSDIAPNRKTDPGPAFNWDILKKHMNADA